MNESPDDIPAFADLAADPEIAPLLAFDPVVRKVKRPDGCFPELQRELIARLAATGTLQQAAWQMGKHATGAEALYKTPSADSFRMSWDAAIIIGRRRNGLDAQPPFMGDVPGITRRGKLLASTAGPLPGQVRNEHGEWEDEASFLARGEEAADSVRAKLLSCRRLFLAEISGSAGKRAAFEILTELPVDWDKAARLEPQPDEPWRPHRRSRLARRRDQRRHRGQEGGAQEGDRQDVGEARAPADRLGRALSTEAKTNGGEADALA